MVFLVDYLLWLLHFKSGYYHFGLATFLISFLGELYLLRKK